ncbi:hypothetical protein [Streptomyces neyagawaensis]|uniref:hypothetical protein n=1 Tax=Streptomyces neyagawaensis TaxID=42238 RepID=UPI00099E7C74|nr:hypothetical protein [Streptomyces neyagawaensis]MCL6734980.1 hypothetical protein [Streptomyces neyagawaensis]MDE1684678.1 hypothetical protein [Streptomyces neyagawaensis]
MSSKPWMFRAAATGVVLATTAATFTVVTPQTAAAHTPPAATDHSHPADAHAAYAGHEHDFESPLSRTQAAQRGGPQAAHIR